VAAGASLLRCGDVMTLPADSLSLIVRRLDEIERKLDRILEELRTPTAIGYSARRGSHPGKD
jgi:tetrahydromethanopterin S-methyltransferase subunit G